MAAQAAVGRTHPGSTVCSTDTPRGSPGCRRIDMFRGSILCCRTDTSRDRTRCCRTDSFRDKSLKLGSSYPWFSACFGLFRFISVYFGFNRNTETRCFAMEAKHPKQTFCFGKCRNWFRFQFRLFRIETSFEGHPSSKDEDGIFPTNFFYSVR
jgi:hypothetical protein